MDLFLQYIEDTHGRLFVSSTLSLITASYYGMAEEELLDILTYNKEVLPLLLAALIINNMY